MICRRCLKLITGKQEVAVIKGASVHKDRRICLINQGKPESLPKKKAA